jgi:hypothetical protein
LVRPLFAAHHSHDVRRGPLSTAFATGVAAWAVRRDGGKSRPLKPQFQPSRNAPHYLPHATNGVAKISFRPAFPARYRRHEGPAWGMLCLTGLSGHDPTGMNKMLSGLRFACALGHKTGAIGRQGDARGTPRD